MAYTSLHPYGVQGITPGSNGLYQLTHHCQPLDQMKFYAPPGITKLSAHITMPYSYDGEEGQAYGIASARGGSEPSTPVIGGTGEVNYMDLWTTKYFIQSGGFVRMLDGTFEEATVGGWVYIYFTHNASDGDTNLPTLTVQQIINMETFDAWYATVVWDDDGNPTGTSRVPTVPFVDPLFPGGNLGTFPPTWPIPWPWDRPFPYPF